MRALLRLLSVIVLLTATAWWFPADAHTGLVSSDPADGSTLDAAPSRIVLTFSEDLKDPSESVVQVAGRPQTWDAEVDGPDLVLTPAGGVDEPTGDWRVSYRVVSADGHPITGTIAFTVAGSTAPTSTPTTAAEPTAPTTAPITATTDEPSAAAGDDDTEPDGSSTPLIVGGIVAALVLLLAGALLMRRDRDTAEGDADLDSQDDDTDDTQ